MSDLVLTAKAIEELEPALTAFAEATGMLGPPREIALWVTDLIRYRRAPHQAKLLMRAADKIRLSGLPTSAVQDKLLRAVLEDGAMEDDNDMQDRWANLLANAGTRPGTVRAAFPKILSELEPGDAAILDHAFECETTPPRGPLRLDEQSDFVGLDNLARLGLLKYDYAPALRATEAGLTTLGRMFLQTCRPPSRAE